MKNWYLDACSLINLYATGKLQDIAATLDLTFYVTPWVKKKEALFIYERQELTQVREIPIDLSKILLSGHLIEEQGLVTEEEVALLVDLTIDLDQGEAETLATAVHRRGGFVTDEAKAIKVISQRNLEVSVLTSIGLIKQWAEEVKLSREELREVLLNVQVGGNFTPGRREPNLAWWNAVLKDKA